MMDVIHFIFEEDSTYASEEQLKSQSGVRVAMYRDFYNKKYKYEYVDPKKKNSQYQHVYVPDSDLGVMSEEEEAQAFSSREDLAQKPVMGEDTITPFDPTAPNPFGGILDAPMDH